MSLFQVQNVPPAIIINLPRLIAYAALLSATLGAFFLSLFPKGDQFEVFMLGITAGLVLTELLFVLSLAFVTFRMVPSSAWRNYQLLQKVGPAFKASWEPPAWLKFRRPRRP